MKEDSKKKVNLEVAMALVKSKSEKTSGQILIMSDTHYNGKQTQEIAKAGSEFTDIFHRAPDKNAMESMNKLADHMIRNNLFSSLPTILVKGDTFETSKQGNFSGARKQVKKGDV